MSFSEYDRIVQYLYTVTPVFQRIGQSAYKKDLSNITALCEALGNPHLKFKAIHIGGTNGKGSSCHTLAAILQCAGYKTGLYTSPHLKRFTERIKVNGVEVSEKFVVDFVTKIKPHIERIKPSFFEITTAMAFDYFASINVDFGVLEVGLGGRLDSTNIVDPCLSLITNIGCDHQDLLGTTPVRIAGEKAGIMKPNRKTIIGERQPEIDNIFFQRAKETHATLEFASDEYEIETVHNHNILYIGKERRETYRLNPCLSGACQERNILGVLSVIHELNRLNYPVSARAVEQGTADVVTLTNLKGRWQKLRDNPVLYCDIAHNKEGIKEVLNMIQSLHFKKLHMILGVSRDKNVSSILFLLPKQAHYYFCQANIPRALPAHELKEKAEAVGLKGVVVQNVNEAISQAKAVATREDLIFVGGSTFIVAEIEDL